MSLRVPSTFKNLGGVAYLVTKPLTVNGVHLTRGDYLPVDSPLRRVPRRLEALCRARFLHPSDGAALVAATKKVAAVVPEVVEVVGAEEVAVPVVAAEEETLTAKDLPGLSFRDLQTYCKQAGVSAHGNAQQLRDRLGAALGQ